MSKILKTKFVGREEERKKIESIFLSTYCLLLSLFPFEIVCNLCGCQGSPRLCSVTLLQVFANINPDVISTNLVGSFAC